MGLADAAGKDAQIAALQSSGQVRLQQLVEWMGRDELRRACERSNSFSASMEILDPQRFTRGVQQC